MMQRSRMPQPRRLAVPLLAFGLGCGLTAALAWFPRHLLRSRLPDFRVGGPDAGYAVAVAGRRLKGVERNLSGLTYNPNSDRIFAVINKPEQVVEIDLCGVVRRILPVGFGADLEGISHVEGDLFVITSERNNMIWGAEIDGDTQKVMPVSLQTLSVSFNQSSNEGIEGLSWDHLGRRLFIANEKDPLKIVEVLGLQSFLLGQQGNLALRIWSQQPSLVDLVGDISSISFNESWRAMALLSHESRRVYRLDGSRSAALLLRLERGHHGLAADVDQPEGLAFGPDGSIYVVAEPNLFYRFAPVGTAGPGPASQPC